MLDSPCSSLLGHVFYPTKYGGCIVTVWSVENVRIKKWPVTPSRNVNHIICSSLVTRSRGRCQRVIRYDTIAEFNVDSKAEYTK